MLNGHNQPQYAVQFNKDHWITERTLFAITGATPEFNSATGTVSGFTPVGSGVTQRATPLGMSLYTPDNSWVDFDIRQDWKGPITVVALCRVNDIADAWGGMFTKNAAEGASQFAVGKYSVEDNLYATVDQGAGVERIIPSTYTELASLNVLAFTHTGDAGSPMSFYKNGIYTGVSYNLGTQPSGAGVLRLGGEPSSSSGFDSDVDWLAFIGVRGVLTTQEITDVSDDIWAPWYTPPRKYWAITSSSTTFTISPLGGITFSGNNKVTKTKILLPVGTINLSGNSPVVKTKVLSSQGTFTLSGDNPVIKSKIISSEGTVVFSGTSPLIRCKVIESSGAVVFSGSASLSGAVSYIITPSGNVSFSGTTSIIKSHIQLPIGKISFSGNAPIDSNTVIITVSTRLPLTGIGK